MNKNVLHNTKHSVVYTNIVQETTILKAYRWLDR